MPSLTISSRDESSGMIEASAIVENLFNGDPYKILSFFDSQKIKLQTIELSCINENGEREYVGCYNNMDTNIDVYESLVSLCKATYKDDNYELYRVDFVCNSKEFDVVKEEILQ